jgi:hypothetical protein
VMPSFCRKLQCSEACRRGGGVSLPQDK